MPNDPIREKFEQAAIDLRLAYRDPDHGVVLFHGIDKLFDVAYRAGRASAIEEMAPAAWLDPTTQDVIIDARKTEWQTHYGIGGIRKATGYTVPLALIPKE